MVDNVSLRTGQTTGLDNTSQLDGLNTADAMGKVSSSLSKLESRKADLEKELRMQEPFIKKAESDIATLKKSIAADKKALSKMSGWEKFWSSKDNRLEASIKNKQARLNNAQNYLNVATQVRSHKQGQLANVNHDLNALGKVMDGLKADLAAKAEMLKSALESGDFEAALGMVLNDRLDGLDTQLKAKVTDMSKRNEDILALNNKLSALKGDPKKNASEITNIQGEIDKLNSDSQLDMIKLQSLTNKRNQAFELMSNLTQKFSQSVDKVIGNIR